MRAFIIIQLVLFSHVVISNDYIFERITARDGLSQNSVLGIYECSDGYLWFATFDGLNRYNGYDFKVFRNSVEDPNSLASNLILSIDEDIHNNLWISTFNDGICRFNKTTERFTTFKNTANNPNLLVSNETEKLLCDSRNNIWITCSSGVTFLEFKDDTIFRTIKFTHTNNPLSLTHNVVTTVYEDSEGRIFFMTEEGIDLLKATNPNDYKNEFVHISPEYQLSMLQSIIETQDGFVFNHFDGISLLKLNEENPMASEVLPIGSQTSHLLVIDKQGDLWAAGFNGLYKYKYIAGKPQPYMFEQHFEAGDGSQFLSQNTLRSIAIDNAGLLWVGTNGGGVMKCNINKPMFNHYRHTQQEGSISINKIWSIYEDSSNNLWFNTEGGGLNLLSAEQHKNYGGGFTAFDVNPPKRQNVSFQMIEVGSPEQPEFIVGVGYPNKVIRVSRKNNTWETEAIYPEINYQVMAVCSDENDVAWLGTYMGGLYKCFYKETSDSLIHFTPDNSAIPSLIIRSITKDSKGRLWIGTDQGLAVLTAEERTRKNPKFEVIRNIPGDSASISNSYTVPVVETSDGEIWIGTFGGGLNQYIEGTTETNGTFIRYGLEEGLPNTTIKQIIEDDLGNLWVTSNLGLSRIDTSRKNIRNYSISDGLQGLEFVDLSGTKLSDGEIILGGTNGFNTFYPNEIFEDSIPPLLVFEDLELLNKVIHVNEMVDGAILLEHALNETKQIELKHYQHSFTIRFSALHYTVPESNQFKYMLDGFDSEWITTSSKARFARYTNISPGRYTFKFLASNCHGLWVKEPKSLTIIIKPPFWKTWWFNTSLFLLIVAGILFLFSWRTKVIRLRNLELEHEVAQRTAELKEKNFELLEQANVLNETNSVLEERQQQIEEQAEELHMQKEELLEQRDRLTEVNTVKDKLFSIIAHDLKNPFSTLSGFLDLLHMKYGRFKDEKRKAMIFHAKNSADSIYILLENLLDWARSQQGTIQFKPRKKNLVALLAANIKLVSGQAQEKSITLELLPENPNMVCHFDPDLMNTIIRNLLTNAIKYTPTLGSVTVTCTSSDKLISISVIDSGVGISEENQKKLFQHDKHFSTYGTNDEKGTGLGLTTVHDFVNMHQGSMQVESTEGKGTTFTVMIPLT